MDRKAILALIFGLLFLLAGAELAWGATCEKWISDSSSVSGLGNLGLATHPTTCNNCTGDGNWTLIAGEYEGVFNGFYWNGTDWASKPASVSGLEEVDSYSAPTICNNCTGDGNWTLISGNDAGTFNGSYWNGTDWASKPASVSGLGDINDTSSPAICNNCTGDGNWTLIAGQAIGIFNGFYWNGTDWASKPASVSGLGDIGIYATLTICNNCTGDGNWTLIAGHDAGTFNGFYWNGTEWVSKSASVSGLGDVGSQSTPTTCNNCTGDGNWTLIAGETDGGFYGFYGWFDYAGLLLSGASSNETSAAWQATINFSVTASDACNLSGAYLQTNTSGTWTSNTGGTSPYTFPSGTTSSQVNFSWSNSTLCDQVVYARIVANNTFSETSTSQAMNVTIPVQSPYLGTTIEPTTLNVTLGQAGGQVNITTNATNMCGLDGAYLETNNTGTWTSNTGGTSPYTFPSSATAGQVNFSWSNSTLCDATLYTHIVINSTFAADNTSNNVSLRMLPEVGGFSDPNAYYNMSECDNASHLEFRLYNTTGTRVNVSMPNITRTWGRECNYNISDALNITLTNRSDYCEVLAYVEMSSSYRDFNVTKQQAVSADPPSNLPTAIASGVIGTILVVYSFVRRRRSS